ncbi:hypothetical protein CWI38_1715p0040, partial [Hamiltosporidium tvaerminnensis]
KCCEDTATLLEGVSIYKYLGIIEDSRGIPTRSSFEEVQSKLIAKVERLCHTRLNAKNLFSAINQHAISLINYHIGVLRLELAYFSKLDDAVRAVLVKNKIHLRPSCKERLYLPRTELGRGLHSVELRSEHMLLQLLDCLEKSKEISTRRAAILKVENNNKTHLALIKGFLKVKYRLVEEVTKKSLEEAQLAKLYNEIEKRKLHSKLYNARKNELVSVSDSSRWLKRGNIRPRDEAMFCYIQDRNVFWGADGMYQHCNKSGKTVDHLATRCEKMLSHDYTRRYNEVIRCLHLLLLNRYKFKSSKRIKSHSVQEIFDNEKYDLLVNELGLIYNYSVEIILYMMTWDGIVTKYHKIPRKRLEIHMNVEAYIQSISEPNAEESWERALMGFIMRAEMHEEPKHPLKEAKNGENGVKEIKKRILHLFFQREEPTNNINDELDLDEETILVKELEKII